ncbi:unnamed protein product [Adineta ricciae]|uniref:G-protein coupled receptors family 1 profile domain-containing protein n=1 Tax=Adineta ricciae TaxID=249248 RepID=A0A815DDU2_ADIRI|nr:unnamed protein product [Adineta ricciae]CAF1482922.1 unnamed protein product [Adineta ricciae]
MNVTIDEINFDIFKDVRFIKNKSKRFARWIILPLWIMASLIHEPLHREMFEYETEIARDYLNNSENTIIDEFESEKNKTSINTIYQNTINQHVSCVIHYSSSVQTYNTFILYFHLLVPFLANLFSALFIIFGSARQRSIAQTDQTYKEHVRQRFHEHKQSIISPIALLILTMPRLVVSSPPGCIRTCQNLWLYLISYFFSFAPSILIFVVPSTTYMNAYKSSLSSWRRRIHQ